MKKSWAREKQQVYFITNTIAGWKNIFVTIRAISIIFESWKFFIERRNINFLAYTVMPSHLHYIVQTADPQSLLSGLK